MWIKNLKTFLLNLKNNKIYSIVTLLGFTISLTFVILLSIYIKNELSVNTGHKNKDRIFRLVNEHRGSFAPPVGQWLQNEFPEIESFTRIIEEEGVIITSKNEKVKFDFLLADSTFFSIFSFNLIEGTAQNALKTRNSVVLTQSYARKLFGDQSPLDQEIELSGVACVVTGVVEDISKTSNFLKVDGIVNFRCLADIWQYPALLTTFENNSFGLFVLAKPNTNLPSKATQILELFKKDYWLYMDDRTKMLEFETFTDSYFSPFPGSGTTSNSKTLIMVLSAIATLVLILAIINYMNLTIAQSGLRVKEIAIKKLLGSSRRTLIVQHILESILLCFTAFILAVICSFLAEPLFNQLLNTELGLAGQITADKFLISIAIVLSVGFISGIIPALVLTKLKAIEVVRGGFRRKSKALYSKILIGFQYTVVIALVIATLTISKQISFMQKFDVGYNTSNVIWLDNNIDINQCEGFRSEMSKIPGVKRISFVEGSPMDGGNNQSYKYNDIPVSFQVFIVDSLFLPMMEIDVTPTNAAYSKKGIWINEATVKRLGLDSLPTTFNSHKGVVPVLGVVRDFNYESLHSNAGMIMIEQMCKESYPWQILIQIEGSNPIATLEDIKKSYSKYTEGLPFNYGFVDDTIQRWYDKEQRTASIVSYFTFLAILISVMGIFAMSMFFNQQKIKEIGIRKVNGATVLEIVLMLNKSILKWVSVAFVIACPIAYYAMQQWLQNYAYKTTLSWWIFVVSGLFSLAIALITVSWQTFRAARRNPIVALRCE